MVFLVGLMYWKATAADGWSYLSEEPFVIPASAAIIKGPSFGRIHDYEASHAGTVSNVRPVSPAFIVRPSFGAGHASTFVEELATALGDSQKKTKQQLIDLETRDTIIEALTGEKNHLIALLNATTSERNDLSQQNEYFQEQLKQTHELSMQAIHSRDQEIQRLKNSLVLSEHSVTALCREKEALQRQIEATETRTKGAESQLQEAREQLARAATAAETRTKDAKRQLQEAQEQLARTKAEYQDKERTRKADLRKLKEGVRLENETLLLQKTVVERRAKAAEDREKEALQRLTRAELQTDQELAKRIKELENTLLRKEQNANVMRGEKEALQQQIETSERKKIPTALQRQIETLQSQLIAANKRAAEAEDRAREALRRQTAAEFQKSQAQLSRIPVVELRVGQSAAQKRSLAIAQTEDGDETEVSQPPQPRRVGSVEVID